MRVTHWGKGTIGLQAAVPKRPHTRPLTFNFLEGTDSTLLLTDNVKCQNYTGSVTKEIWIFSIGGMRENLYGFHRRKRKTDRNFMSSSSRFPNDHYFSLMSFWYEQRADENVYGTLLECYWQGNTEAIGVKPFQLLLCLPQLSHGLSWDQTRASAVWGLRLSSPLPLHLPPPRDTV